LALNREFLIVKMTLSSAVFRFVSSLNPIAVPTPPPDRKEHLTNVPQPSTRHIAAPEKPVTVHSFSSRVVSSVLAQT
jgi:hypothetical protein